MKLIHTEPVAESLKAHWSEIKRTQRARRAYDAGARARRDGRSLYAFRTQCPGWVSIIASEAGLQGLPWRPSR